MTLIERLEAAECGSRELDFQIWLELERDVKVVPETPARVISEREDEFALYNAAEQCIGWVGFHMVPRYSESLDAALALAERMLGDDWLVDVTRRPNWHTTKGGRAFVTDGCGRTGESDFARTPALALCAAILRAIQPKESEG